MGRSALHHSIKALSNQKYQEFVARFGEDRWSFDRDTSINGEADVLVMTTEVLGTCYMPARIP